MALGIFTGPDTTPPLITLERFGSREWAFEEHQAAGEWKSNVRKVYHMPDGDPFPSRWRPWCSWHYDEADRMYLIYDRLTDAWSWPSNPSHLRAVRELVGERAYWTGALPRVPRLLPAPPEPLPAPR